MDAPFSLYRASSAITGTNRLDRRDQRWLFVKARLKDAESAARAQANLALIMEQLAKSHPKTNAKRPITVAAHVGIHPQGRRIAAANAAALVLGVGLVLMVRVRERREHAAGARVGPPAGSRDQARDRREPRPADSPVAHRERGARPDWRRQRNCPRGGPAAAGGGDAVTNPDPIALSLRIDFRVLLFTTLAAIAAGLLAGLAPALRATRSNLVADLKGDAAGMKAGRRRWGLRDGLVALQKAFTLVLRIAAGLLARSVAEAHRIDLGFKPAGLAAVSSELGLVGYSDDKAKLLYERALERSAAFQELECYWEPPHWPITYRHVVRHTWIRQGRCGSRFLKTVGRA